MWYGINKVRDKRINFKMFVELQKASLKEENFHKNLGKIKKKTV